jgi:hypothetical protein
VASAVVALTLNHIARSRGGADLFVAAEDIADGRRARESLVNLHRCTAGVRKNCVDTLPLKSLYNCIAALARLVAVPVNPVICIRATHFEMPACHIFGFHPRQSVLRFLGSSRGVCDRGLHRGNARQPAGVGRWGGCAV